MQLHHPTPMHTAVTVAIQGRTHHSLGHARPILSSPPLLHCLPLRPVPTLHRRPCTRMGSQSLRPARRLRPGAARTLAAPRERSSLVAVTCGSISTATPSTSSVASRGARNQRLSPSGATAAVAAEALVVEADSPARRIVRGMRPNTIPESSASGAGRKARSAAGSSAGSTT